MTPDKATIEYAQAERKRISDLVYDELTKFYKETGLIMHLSVSCHMSTDMRTRVTEMISLDVSTRVELK